MGPIGCPDTFVTNNQSTPPEMPEDRRSPYRAAEAYDHAWLPLVWKISSKGLLQQQVDFYFHVTVHRTKYLFK